jgi:aryl-alcohol dehydrogenase-like predicted oxidoreductase
VFHQQGVTGAIAGSRSPKHVIENAAAGSVDLSQEVLDEIEKTISES